MQDQYGYFGPTYSYADNIPLPGQIGVRKESSIGAIIDAVGGINYYIDTIAFGGPTFFDSHNPTPMGLRYFLNTEMRCSNGATMSEFFDGVTKGDLLGTRVAAALESTGLPGLKGLAPGMLENARDALDPRPIFAAVTATGYPVCQKVSCPVGDFNGNIRSAQDEDDPTIPAKNPFIIDPVQYDGDAGKPTQTRWVQGLDAKGYPINITSGEFAATPKCYNPDGTYMAKPAPGCPATEPVSIPTKGKGKYKLCTVLQKPTLPANLREGFSGVDRTEYGIRTLHPPRVGEIAPEYGDPYSVLPLKCINSALCDRTNDQILWTVCGLAIVGITLWSVLRTR